MPAAQLTRAMLAEYTQEDPIVLRATSPLSEVKRWLQWCDPDDNYGWVHSFKEAWTMVAFHCIKSVPVERLVAFAHEIDPTRVLTPESTYEELVDWLMANYPKTCGFFDLEEIKTADEGWKQLGYFCVGCVEYSIR